MARRNQPSLFDDLATLPPPSAELVELGRRVPAAIKFGTSTWTYDGWAGDVYHRSYRGAQPARLRGARGVLRVRVPADARQGPPRSRALGGRPGGLPPAAAARFPLCGRIAEPRAADRRVPRRTGAPRSGARLQFVDRDAHDWRAARAAGDSPGALHRRAGVAPTGTPLRRRGEAVRAVRSDSRSAARAAAGPAAVGRRGAEAADRGLDPRQQPARGKRAGDDSRAGRRVDRGAAVSGDRPPLAELPPPRPELVALAAALPPGIKFGTASWTVDGWTGDGYHRSYRGAQPAARLEEYVRYPLFRTVGINSAFYESPSERILHAYARALPEGYSCVVKVWDRITARRFIRDRRWGPLAGQLNPDFLDARLFLDHVLAHYARAFSRHASCFVFQFQAMRGTDLLDAAEWAERLDRFFRQLPQDFRYAVELRNAELMTDHHGAVLQRHGVAHVFNSWTEMPPIGTQLHLPWTLTAPFTVARALLKPGRKYADAVRAFEPYDRVREVLPELRRDLLGLMGEARRRGIEAVIHVNNRAEGNAPGTIRELAEQWINGRGA